MILVALDAAHGGRDPGAVGPTGLQEKTVALALALEVEKQLADDDRIAVLQIRRDDRFVALDARAKLANTRKASVFVSIHINSATTPTAHGTETFAFAPGGAGEKLARAIQQNLVRMIKLRDRGVKFQNSFAVLRFADMPAALVEVCFINNPAEEQLLRDPAFLGLAATGIADGIAQFLGEGSTPRGNRPKEGGLGE